MCGVGNDSISNCGCSAFNVLMIVDKKELRFQWKRIWSNFKVLLRYFPEYTEQNHHKCNRIVSVMFEIRTGHLQDSRSVSASANEEPSLIVTCARMVQAVACFSFKVCSYPNLLEFWSVMRPSRRVQI
jgi:hypothetical protein